MSKAVLISIQPKWCSLIANGDKTIEVRKARPKLEPPFKCYIYCTLGKQKPHELLEIHGCDGKIRKANGMVIGEFVCEKLSYIEAGVDVFGERHLYNTVFLQHSMCLTEEELFRYLYKGKDKNNGGWGWHLKPFILYDTPKLLSEFTGLRETKFGFAPAPITRAPQSWCYVEELNGGADHA